MLVRSEQLRKLTDWTDRGSAGREWDGVMPLFSSGESGFLFMGDWALGTFNASGLEPEVDYVCAGAPKDWNDTGFILNSDSVIFFQQSDADYQAGQKLLAELIMSGDFQTIFNQAKGSIPARLDVDLSEGFNPCQQQAQADLQAAIENGTLVRSMAHNMSVPQRFRGVMLEVITEFVNTPGMSPEEAAQNLALAVEDQL